MLQYKFTTKKCSSTQALPHFYSIQCKNKKNIHIFLKIDHENPTYTTSTYCIQKHLQDKRKIKEIIAKKNKRFNSFDFLNLLPHSRIQSLKHRSHKINPFSMGILLSEFPWLLCSVLLALLRPQLDQILIENIILCRLSFADYRLPLSKS